MSSEISVRSTEYGQWLGELKTRFRQVQLKAAVAVNTAMLQFYWDLGADIVVKQKQFAWGSSFLKQLSTDLMREFPDVRGFSVRNLKYIRQWHEFWLVTAIGQQPVAQLTQRLVSQILSIPWGHTLSHTLSHTLPEALRDKLPSIEAIERELGLDGATP